MASKYPSVTVLQRNVVIGAFAGDPDDYRKGRPRKAGDTRTGTVKVGKVPMRFRIGWGAGIAPAVDLLDRVDRWSDTWWRPGPESPIRSVPRGVNTTVWQLDTDWGCGRPFWRYTSNNASTGCIGRNDPAPGPATWTVLPDPYTGFAFYEAWQRPHPTLPNTVNSGKQKYYTRKAGYLGGAKCHCWFCQPFPVALSGPACVAVGAAACGSMGCGRPGPMG